jgi:hypothetical protein
MRFGNSSGRAAGRESQRRGTRCYSCNRRVKFVQLAVSSRTVPLSRRIADEPVVVLPPKCVVNRPRRLGCCGRFLSIHSESIRLDFGERRLRAAGECRLAPRSLDERRDLIQSLSADRWPDRFARRPPGHLECGIRVLPHASRLPLRPHVAAAIGPPGLR